MFEEFNFFIRYYYETATKCRGVNLVIFLLLVSLGVIFSFVEGIPIFQGIYFSFITALTVGYGDIIPHTALGQFLSLIIGILGVIFFGIIVGISSLAIHRAIASMTDKYDK
jgi:voltage-gated potassium channel